MEGGNVLSQMSQYDFRTPINVTMIFDDSDEETSTKTTIKEEIKTEENNSNHETIKTTESDLCPINTNITSKKDSQTEILAASQPINSNDVASNTMEKMQATQSPNLPEVDVVQNNQNSTIINNNNQIPTEKLCHYTSAIYQRLNDNEELTAYVKDLLNTLSEHLILIMQPYYYYYYKKPNVAMSTDLSMQLNKLKAHFFDLSYSTVVSLILPQENNEDFIQKFIDKTANEANKSKILNWKCERHHVLPFFNEMVEWTRQKRARIKSLGLPQSHVMRRKNDRILKEKSSNPPRLLNGSPPSSVPLKPQNSNNKQGSDNENTRCIFSCGSPGREISININPDTLKQIENNKSDKQPANKIQRLENSFYPSPTQPTKQVLATREVYNRDRSRHRQAIQQNAYQQSHTIHHRPVPPRPPQLPQYASMNYNTPATNSPNYHHNLNQVQQNIQAMQNYNRNINPFTVAAINQSHLGITYYPQSLGGPGPIITNVTSLNSSIGRCCICGKVTTSTCSKCKNFSYCSYLCQELDSGVHKSVCGKSNH